MTDGRCTKCGDTWGDSVNVICRTDKAECFVFRGDKDDPRNGLKFHNKDAIILGNDVHVVRISTDPINIINPYPVRRERDSN